MCGLITPHGSPVLRSLLIEDAELIEAKNYANSLRKILISSREMSDLLLLSMGAYTPLTGFVDREDWHSICTDMKLKDGIFWPIPITLSISSEEAEAINVGEEVTLVEEKTLTNMAILKTTDCYEPAKEFECEKIFNTLELEHPGVQKVFSQKQFNLAGSIKVIDEGWFPKRFANSYMRPNESRELFEQLKWKKVAAFQTRNPMHRGHEYLVKTAIEHMDGVFIHQSLGKLKQGDIPAEVRVKAIEALVENYFEQKFVQYSGYPIEMRYAGPREALLHAIIRQNFGCSHLIIGRDHAGVGDYYGPYDSQLAFKALWDGALELKPLPFDVAFYCHFCDGMASLKTCPHDASHHVNISGTMHREMLENKEEISKKFSRPEVVNILRDYYENRQTNL